MAPIKFEENIKSTLEERRIQPSNTAWNVLESSLDVKQGKSKKRNLKWLGIAASFIGIIWITSILFKTEILQVEPTIVDTPELKQPIPEQVESSEMNIVIDEPEKESDIQKEQITIKDGQNMEIKEPSESIAKIDEEIVAKKTIEEEAVLEIAIQIAVLNEKNIGVTDEEIDLLLKEAQLKIAMKKQVESGLSVNAYALLVEVENELDPTFKEKVFDVLKENYYSVKNAVAQRND